jgi:hypothetical protein
MSSDDRPWYRWFPKEFMSDEKVQSLSPVAEVVYRRALDVMWQANALQLPCNCIKLAYAIGKGLDKKQFEDAWAEIQFQGFELFKTSECGNWIYSERLRKEKEHVDSIRKIRSDSAKKRWSSKSNANAYANAMQKECESESDIKEKYKKKAPSKKPSRTLPEDFCITQEMRAWFGLQDFKRVDIEHATNEFIDYWKGNGKAKSDWEATWRNWMRKAESYNGGGQSKPQSKIPGWL